MTDSASEGETFRGQLLASPAGALPQRGLSHADRIFLDEVVSRNPQWTRFIEIGTGVGAAAIQLALLARTRAGTFRSYDTQDKRCVEVRRAWMDNTEFHVELDLKDQLGKIADSLDAATLVVAQAGWIDSALNTFGAQLPVGAGLLTMGARPKQCGGQLPHEVFEPYASLKNALGSSCRLLMREASSAQRARLDNLTKAFEQAHSGSGQMAPTQTFRVVTEILHRAPCNLLVFGAGRDTALYAQANAGGRTTVVEDQAKWLEQAKGLGCELIQVRYSTLLAKGFIDNCPMPEGLPPGVLDSRWDIILVDGPSGHRDDMPGRQQSIFAASRLANRETALFLHDYNRPFEQRCASEYLGQPREKFGKHTLLAVFDAGAIRAEQPVAPAQPTGRSSPPATATRDATIRKQPATGLLYATHQYVGLQVDADVDVSIVIPTYNEGQWLEWTIDSILEATSNATYEIVVVDDGGDDGSVQAVANKPRVRVCSTGGNQIGCVIGRNRGASASRGRYLCFLDSHVLVHDHWLDYLRETCEKAPASPFVSGNLLNVDSRSPKDLELRKQWSYTLKSWMVESSWHYHGRNIFQAPYEAPLCPSGLMFVARDRFEKLGGFWSLVRKWGGTDVELSLKNYFCGGDTLVDPRVVVYHYYKNRKDKKPSFSVNYKDVAFNRMLIAKTFFPTAEFERTYRAITAGRGDVSDVRAELESGRHDAEIAAVQAQFRRGYAEWVGRFSKELHKILVGEKVAKSPAL